MSAGDRRVTIGIIGDFDRGKHSHWATEAALFHAAARAGLTVEPRWVATPVLAAAGDVAACLAEFDGLWGAPGSPYASFDGVLRGIEFARRSAKPYLGTCAGFQYALIELTRNVLGIADADSAENGSDARTIVITPVACALPGSRAGGPRLDGSDVIRAAPGSLVERLIGGDTQREEYFCSFETNADFIPRWEAAGLRVAARGAGDEMRALELPAKAFHVATLFQPQLSSSFASPHPIVEGFLRACSR